jgi:hypothetical protein
MWDFIPVARVEKDGEAKKITCYQCHGDITPEKASDAIDVDRMVIDHYASTSDPRHLNVEVFTAQGHGLQFRDSSGTGVLYLRVHEDYEPTQTR